MKMVCIAQREGITAGSIYDVEELFVWVKEENKRKKTYHIENDLKEERYYWPEHFMTPEDYRDKRLEEIGII